MYFCMGGREGSRGGGREVGLWRALEASGCGRGRGEKETVKRQSEYELSLK